MPLAKGGLAHYAIDVNTGLLTAQAFVAGLASVVAYGPSFAMRGLVGDVEFVQGAPRHYFIIAPRQNWKLRSQIHANGDPKGVDAG